MGKGGKNKDAETRGTKSCLFHSVVLDTPYMECYSRWNLKCQPRPQAEKKRVSPSLAPRPVYAIRVIRGGLEPRANFPDKLDR